MAATAALDLAVLSSLHLSPSTRFSIVAQRIVGSPRICRSGGRRSTQRSWDGQGDDASALAMRLKRADESTLTCSVTLVSIEDLRRESMPLPFPHARLFFIALHAARGASLSPLGTLDLRRLRDSQPRPLPEAPCGSAFAERVGKNKASTKHQSQNIFVSIAYAHSAGRGF